MGPSLRFALMQHRILRVCSKSYRDHDAIVLEREHWRREYIVAGNETATLRARVRELDDEIAEVHGRLKLAIEAQQKAAEQLIAERALRQAADERAGRYHGELADALKAAANWSTKALNRKSMFSEADATEEIATQKAEPQEISGKRMARRVARDATNATLLEMLEQMRKAQPDDMPVGPEFTTQ